MSNSIFIHLVYNSALLFPVVILYTSFSFKKFEETRLKQMIVGFLIALIGIVIMSNPMKLTSGIFFDSRNILLGISAMFFPLISTLIAMVSMLLLRIFSGGDGMLTGVVNIITSVGIGLIWRALRHDFIVNSEKNHWAELLSVSVINHIFVF